jgi:hypothetical protein
MDTGVTEHNNDFFHNIAQPPYLLPAIRPPSSIPDTEYADILLNVSSNM